MEWERYEIKRWCYTNHFITCRKWVYMYVYYTCIYCWLVRSINNKSRIHTYNCIMINQSINFTLRVKALVNDESIKINGLMCVRYWCISVYTIELKEKGVFMCSPSLACLRGHAHVSLFLIPLCGMCVRTILRWYRFILVIKRIAQLNNLS